MLNNLVPEQAVPLPEVHLREGGPDVFVRELIQSRAFVTGEDVLRDLGLRLGDQRLRVRRP